MGTITVMDLRQADLNLLVCLQALLKERHVTRAAEHLGVTQPAMSAALARLRALFRDELLVRGPRGMTLTARAEVLGPELDVIMARIKTIIAVPPVFVASESQRTFTLIGSDFIEHMVLPKIARTLTMGAPSLQLNFRPPNPRNLEMLLNDGEVDLAIGYLPDISPHLLTKALFEDRFVCIARRDHPDVRGEITLEAFVRLSHVQVLPRDATMYAAPIDEALSQLSLVRRISLWQPSFVPAGKVVAETDLVSTVPRRLAEALATMFPITLHEPPLRLPDMVFSMFWHPRSQHDAGHKWLRDVIAGLFH